MDGFSKKSVKFSKRAKSHTSTRQLYSQSFSQRSVGEWAAMCEWMDMFADTGIWENRGRGVYGRGSLRYG